MTPNRGTGVGGRPLLLRSGEPLTGPVVTVSQDGRLLWRHRVVGPVPPSRLLRLLPGWMAQVDRAGGPLVVDIG
ncbi:hypothetical protein [Streptomyces sp. NPDC060035]|uniref:hypothetical protein n=1 Tax=Streptomyces sp. NPDC060035 TaxID=3347044 RepID=UPI0036B6C550